MVNISLRFLVFCDATPKRLCSRRRNAVRCDSCMQGTSVGKKCNSHLINLYFFLSRGSSRSPDAYSDPREPVISQSCRSESFRPHQLDVVMPERESMAWLATPVVFVYSSKISHIVKSKSHRRGKNHVVERCRWQRDIDKWKIFTILKFDSHRGG